MTLPVRLKQRLFVAYPDDLHPSRLAVAMARVETLTEYMIALVLVTS